MSDLQLSETIKQDPQYKIKSYTMVVILVTIIIGFLLAIGRFGPYLRFDGKFTSIKKDDNEDPLTISLERAIELIEIKIQADKDRLVANFEGSPHVQVLNGRYGVFIQVTPDKGKKINGRYCSY